MEITRIKNGLRVSGRFGMDFELKGKGAFAFLRKTGFDVKEVRKLPVGTVFNREGVL
jgi:hypothetical protein